MSLRTVLAGTGVALITPFKQNEEVDFEALAKMINYVIDGGVNYIVSLGTTGETPTLDPTEQHAIVHYIIEIINNRVPIVVGVGGNNTKQLVKILEQFSFNNIAAILSASPYYNKPTQHGIIQHYKALAAASPKPIILYNVPGRTSRNMSAATTLALAEVPNIGGIKEASGDMMQCMQILQHRPADFLVTSGDDALAMSQIALGMDGVISVAANCVPKQFSDLINRCLQHNFTDAKAIQDLLLPLYDLLFVENNPAGAKAFLYETGLIENVLRLPLTPLTQQNQVLIKDFITTL
jgi:4-hydroxy-tetrahydrodipicolinate synthase